MSNNRLDDKDITLVFFNMKELVSINIHIFSH